MGNNLHRTALFRGFQGRAGRQATVLGKEERWRALRKLILARGQNASNGSCPSDRRGGRFISVSKRTTKENRRSLAANAQMAQGGGAELEAPGLSRRRNQSIQVQSEAIMARGGDDGPIRIHHDDHYPIMEVRKEVNASKRGELVRAQKNALAQAGQMIVNATAQRALGDEGSPQA